jgi:predicted Zn finger-like uncharacterized protein
MILVCPSCDTRYFADDSALGDQGRRVRCTSCGHAWFAKPEEQGGLASAAEGTGLTREQVERLRQTSQATSIAKTAPHSEYRAREQARRQRNRVMASGVAWLLAFTIFGGAATAAVVFRDQVAAAWPKSASLFRLVGLDVNRFGLELADVESKRSFQGTTPVLTVTGVAVNAGKRSQPAPNIRVSLKDDSGKQVHTWTDTLSVPRVGPGEKVPFTTKIIGPPVDTFNVSVTFEPFEARREPSAKDPAHKGEDAAGAHGAGASAAAAPVEAADEGHAPAVPDLNAHDAAEGTIEGDLAADHGEPADH